MKNITDWFRMDRQKEEYSTVAERIYGDSEFTGTNLWILVFAIFIASLGLNVGSTAVVIGAMLISPLMGPIIGLGFGMATNDLELLRKASSNFLFAIGVSLATSTIYFALSPLDVASSELAARTTPTIFDALIALFGGLAGAVAASSKQKGNVIPGVAIATALMPPLCTVGYGIAHWNLRYIGGAFYLFTMNTVFIAVATLVTAKLLKFPRKKLPNEKEQAFSSAIIWSVVVITLLPSFYFGYEMVKRSQFESSAEQYIKNETTVPNTFLLRKVIDAEKQSISLTYIGEHISEAVSNELRSGLSKYGLKDAVLVVSQDTSAIAADDKNEHDKRLTYLLSEKEKELQSVKEKINSKTDQKPEN